MHKRIVSSLLAGFLCLAVCAPPLMAAEVQLDRGVVYRQINTANQRGEPLQIHIVDVNLNDPRVELKLATAPLSKTKTVSSFARENYAVAGINGGYFFTGSLPIPVDTVVLDGAIVAKGSRDPASFGIIDDHRVFIDAFRPHMVATLARNFRQFPVEAVNHPCGVGLIMYTPLYGSKTGTPPTSLEFTVESREGKSVVTGRYNGNAPIPANGYVLSFQGVTSNIADGINVGDALSVATYFPDSYPQIRDLLACGPLLLKNGRQVPITLTPEEKNLSGRNPRSALGLTASNHLLLVAVDGRQKQSVGMTYSELATFMKNLGAVNAMALDGGGSTALWAGTGIANRPSGGRERSVVNAVLVVSQIPVFIDGKRVYFEVPPVIESGRTLVPLRKMFEVLGAQVDWNPTTRTVTAARGSNTLSLVIGQKMALINGVEMELDVAPVIRNGRTLVPLRVVADALGGVVEWDPVRETIFVSTAPRS